MAWEPTVVVTNWGRLQLVVGGVDVTFYRGVPVQIGSWSFNEPFDDASLQVGFPQITPFEALPSWLHDYASCELNLIRPDGSAKRLWEGLFIGEDDRLSQTQNELAIQFLGAIYQGDLFKMPPDINKHGTQDISVIISRELSPVARPSLRLNPIIQRGYTGVVYGQAGSWDPLVTGYIQDMLAIATSSGLPIPGEALLGITMTPSGDGYWMTGTLGSVLAFGDARYWGSMLGTPLNEPANRIAPHPNGKGYWFAAKDGGVFSFGHVAFHGSIPGIGVDADTIVGIDSTPSGNGYWLVAKDGGVFAFGDAGFFGAMPEVPPDPVLVAGDAVVDAQVSPDGGGYVLLTRQGRVYSFGSAPYHGNGNRADSIAVDVASDRSGYWILTDTGQVQMYGDPYRHYGDREPFPDNAAFVEVKRTPSNNGYWLFGADGSVHAYGDAGYFGSVPEAGAPDLVAGDQVIGAAVTASGGGYAMVTQKGYVFAFGDAPYHGGGNGNANDYSAIGLKPDNSGYWLLRIDGTLAFYGTPYSHYGDRSAEIDNGYMVEVVPTSTGAGYWMFATDGAVFAFGDAGYFGSIPDPVDDPNALVAGEEVVDIARTPSGNGYWLLTNGGRIYAFGDAGYFGGVTTGGIVAMAARPQGDGYWLLHADGTVYHFGGGAHHGDHGVLGEAMPMTDIASSPTGNGYVILGGDGGVFTYGDAPFHGSVPGGGGWTSQWTIMNAGNRTPELRIKNMWDNHWTVRIGTPGVEHSFSRDLKTAPNVLYGEGTDLEDRHWRNTKYPNYFPDTPPMTGPTIQIGSTHPDVFVWKTAMDDSGWDMYGMDTLAAGLYTQTDSNQCRAFQQQAGLTPHGAVDSATWDATFNPGVNANDLDSAFFMPLAQDPRAEKYFYSPRGGIIGLNPLYDPNFTRVEQANDYGARVTRQEGIISAHGQLERDFPARYTGMLTLTTDPPEGSRWEIRAGENITVQGHRGVDRFFHISQVNANFAAGTVTVTVDEAGKDALTLAAFRSRYRDVTDPARRASPRATLSNITFDSKALWDHENGGGRIMRHHVTAGAWSVVRVPAGESGNVVHSRFWTDVPSRFAVAVFEYPISENELSRLGPPNSDTFWDQFSDPNVTAEPGEEVTGGGGLAVVWGTEGQMGGFWPGIESEGGEVTGQMRDDASWYYESTIPPWLWVAVWCDTSTYFQGRLYPAPDSV